ncbi:hypothetical protein AOLI_G00166290 [Acnodon oligacanthus]
MAVCVTQLSQRDPEIHSRGKQSAVQRCGEGGDGALGSKPSASQARAHLGPESGVSALRNYTNNSAKSPGKGGGPMPFRP